LRIKEQETRLTLHEHGDDDDDDEFIFGMCVIFLLTHLISKLSLKKKLKVSVVFQPLNLPQVI